MSLRTIALGAITVVGLAACSGQPNPRAVVEDLIESVDGPTEAQRACMLEQVDGYTTDEIEAIGDENKAVDFDNPEALAATTPEFQQFVARLRSCL